MKEHTPQPTESAKRPFSLERLLIHTWPCSEEEADEFVEMIYADRKAPENKPPFT
jgi:hypothetical protein